MNGSVTAEVLDEARLVNLPVRRADAARPGWRRVLWDAWKAYGQRAGGYQAELLLSGVYFLVLGPSALFARLTGTKLLDLDRRPRPSYWLARPPADTSLQALGRQF